MYNLDFDEDTVTRFADALYTVATDNGIDILIKKITPKF